MSNPNQKIQKDTKDSIPIYYNGDPSYNKKYLIGKVNLKSNKSSYKLTNKNPYPPSLPKNPENSKNTKNDKTNNPPKIEGPKEFFLIDKTNKSSLYKGREGAQDSKYVLMKYSSKDNEIHMYPANNWVNFFTSPIRIRTEKEKGKEPLDEKEKRKKKNQLRKTFFNTDNEYNVEEKQKQKKKKKGLLDNNKDDEFGDEPKKKLAEFKEDSHSSEIELELGYDSFDDEEKEKNKEEKKIKEVKKKEEKSEEEEEEESEDKESNSNDDYDNNDDNNIDFMNKYSNLMGKKRERENNPGYDIEERLENLLRKKDRMTEEEIIGELKKEYKIEIIEKYLFDVIDKITSKFTDDDGAEYYYLKK